VSEQRIQHVIRGELVRQAESDWSQLALVPCTATWRAVAHLRKMPEERRAHLFALLESVAVSFFRATPGPSGDLTKDPEYKHLVEALVGVHEWNWAYASVRTLRSVLGAYRSKSPKIAAEVASTPPDVIARAEHIVPIKATELRRLVKSAVAERFGAKPDHSGGGDWLYRGKSAGLEFVLGIDYGGYDQLRYEVSFDDAATGISARRLNYERLMGCSGTGWDFLTADNAAPSIDLMCTLVETLVSIPARASSLGGPTKR
jgi:hypothetical protein